MCGHNITARCTVRKSIVIFIISCIAVVFSLVAVAAQEISPPATPAQLAAAIARTMMATRPVLPPNSPITQTFSSRGNVVESRTTFKDADGFERATESIKEVQFAMSRYMCKEDRLAYMKRGVIFREIKINADGSKSVAFNIDEKFCASLPNFSAADPITVARLAQGVAQRLTAVFAQGRQPDGSYFEPATVQGGDVRLVNVVNNMPLVGYLRKRDFEVRGRTQALLCHTFGDAIRLGVTIHVAYRLESGAIILEFPVDKTFC